MAADSKVIALLSACISLGTSGAVAALAIERDRNVEVVRTADDLCPPGACTIVTKTPEGGAPSVVYTVPLPASVAPSTVRPQELLVAAVDPLL